VNGRSVEDAHEATTGTCRDPHQDLPDARHTGEGRVARPGDMDAPTLGARPAPTPQGSQGADPAEIQT